MKTRSQKRARSRRVSLAGGETAPQVAKQGRRTDLERPEDPAKSALKTRLRIRGIRDTPDNLKRAVAPAFGSDVGLCIDAILTGDDAAKAWDTFSHISASYRNYMVYFVGQTGNPKCAAIAMIPDAMETDPSLRVDIRTHDERVSAAKASWAAWERRIKALPFPQMAWALQGALRGFLGDGTLWRDAKPTHTGRTVVAALRAMGAE
jgi:hypothetical protein